MNQKIAESIAQQVGHGVGPDEILNYWNKFWRDMSELKEQYGKKKVKGHGIEYKGKGTITKKGIYYLDGLGYFTKIEMLLYLKWKAITYDKEAGTWRIVQDATEEVKKDKRIIEIAYPKTLLILSELWAYHQAAEHKKNSSLEDLGQTVGQQFARESLVMQLKLEDD